MSVIFCEEINFYTQPIHTKRWLDAKYPKQMSKIVL